MGSTTTYFDCCAGYGYFEVSPLKPARTPADLLAEMDACGIARALVYNAVQVDGSPVDGNPAILREIAAEERLVPTWTILTPQTGEFPEPHDLAARMEDAGVRALRAFPDKHRYLLSPGSLRGLLEVINARRIPLFLMQTPWEQVEALLQAFPGLVLVMCARSVWGDDRYFRPLLEHYHHFYLDTSRYELNGGIGALCARYGHRQLVFGTNFPYTPMGGPRLTLDGADIDEEARQAIASGNLERILAEVDLP